MCRPIAHTVSCVCCCRCRACFDGLVDSTMTRKIKVPGGTLNIRPKDAIPRCPICREPATTAKPMSALASVCKASDPEAFAARNVKC